VIFGAVQFHVDRQRDAGGQNGEKDHDAVVLKNGAAAFSAMLLGHGANWHGAVLWDISPAPAGPSLRLSILLLQTEGLSPTAPPPPNPAKSGQIETGKLYIHIQQGGLPPLPCFYPAKLIIPSTFCAILHWG
jgi:hypothetical protein